MYRPVPSDVGYAVPGVADQEALARVGLHLRVELPGHGEAQEIAAQEPSHGDPGGHVGQADNCLGGLRGALREGQEPD